MKQSTIITIILAILVGVAGLLIAKGTDNLSVATANSDCQKTAIEINGNTVNSFDEFRSISGLTNSDAEMQQAGLVVEDGVLYDTLCREAFS